MPKVNCDGWWEQAGLGRQPMIGLQLEVRDRQLSGVGIDVVGDFLIEGLFKDQSVLIQKQYIGKHTVQYVGTLDGEGVYAGDWSIEGVIGGRWWMRIRDAADPESEIQEFRP